MNAQSANTAAPTPVETEDSGKRIMALVDHDPSTKRAFKEVLKLANKNHDHIFVVHVYSTWDYLNEEQNDGKLILFDYTSYAKALGYSATSHQVGAANVRKEVVNLLSQMEIDICYAGSRTLADVSSDSTNLIFWAVSSLRRLVGGTVIDYVVKNAKCKVVVVN